MDLQGVMSLCHYIQSQNSAERLKVLFPITQQLRLVVPVHVVIASNKFLVKFLTAWSLEYFLFTGKQHFFQENKF